MSHPGMERTRYTPEPEDLHDDPYGNGLCMRKAKGEYREDAVGLPKGKAGNQKILIYQGARNMGRGIELMIEAMRHMRRIQPLDHWNGRSGPLTTRPDQSIRTQRPGDF